MIQRAQKLQKVGNSAAVILPKEWLDMHRLKPGSKVRLLITEDQVILMSDEPDREIPVDAAFVRHADRLIKRHRKTLERLA